MIVVSPADFLYRGDMQEHQMWLSLNDSPDVHAFFMTVTERNDGRVTGSLYEMELSGIQDSIREYGFFFTHLDAEMKDGTSRRFTLEEWDAMDRYERDQLKSWTRQYDSADKADLAAYLGAFRWTAPEYRRHADVSEFLAQISEPYMARADNPQPGMIRVTPDAAKEILTQSAVDVFRLTPNGMEKLSPIDAIKVPMRCLRFLKVAQLNKKQLSVHHRMRFYTK